MSSSFSEIFACWRLRASARRSARWRRKECCSASCRCLPACTRQGSELLFVAVVGMTLKGVVFPWLLFRAVRETRISRDVQPYVGYSASVMIGVVGLAGMFLLSERLAPFPAGASSLLVTAALFSVFTGLFLIVSRKRAINQVLGFLVLENGVYLFGAGVMSETSLLVEVGILLDVFVAVFVMGIALFHINREFDHIETDRLSSLKN